MSSYFLGPTNIDFFFLFRQVKSAVCNGPPSGLSGAVGVLFDIEPDSLSKQIGLFIIGGHGYNGSVNTVYRLDVSSVFQSNSAEPNLKWKNLSEPKHSRSFSPRDKFAGWEHRGK